MREFGENEPRSKQHKTYQREEYKHTAATASDTFAAFEAQPDWESAAKNAGNRD